MASCSLTHHHAGNSPKSILSGIVQQPWFVIHRTAQHPSKRQRHIVLRSRPRRPDVVFRPQHPLTPHGIRIGTIEALARKSPVKHKMNAVFCTCGGDPMVKIHCELIVPMNEIGHNTINAPVVELRESFLQIPVQFQSQSPYAQLDSPLTGITGDFLDVDLRRYVVQIGHITPTGVQHNMAESETGRKIYVIFIRRRIDTGPERNIVQVDVRNPFIRSLDSVQPRGIPDSRR